MPYDSSHWQSYHPASEQLWVGIQPIRISRIKINLLTIYIKHVGLIIIIFIIFKMLRYFFFRFSKIGTVIQTSRNYWNNLKYGSYLCSIQMVMNILLMLTECGERQEHVLQGASAVALILTEILKLLLEVSLVFNKYI